MPLRKRPDTGYLRVGDRVVSVEAIGAIPEGTRGRIKLVDGFAWIRYWVAWETGEWTGSVDNASVVAASRLEQFLLARSAAAEQAASPAAAGGAAPADPGAAADAPAAGGGIPEHLLERSRQARARKAAQAAG